MNEQEAAVARMTGYIEDHLLCRITASDLAKAAGYSQYHAARLFRSRVGLSPFEYIRRERMLRSAAALRKDKVKVLDVAFDYVFDSHEGFTRAFTQVFGINPKKFASHPRPDGWRIPYRYLDRSKKEEDSGMQQTYVIFTQIVERPKRKLILLRSKKADNYFDYCEEIGCGKSGDSYAWDLLSEIKEALYEPAGLWLPENLRTQGTGIYAHGVEVGADYTGGVPAGFDLIDLEPCKFLVFQGEPYNDQNFQEAVGLCMDRI